LIRSALSESNAVPWRAGLNQPSSRPPSAMNNENETLLTSTRCHGRATVDGLTHASIVIASLKARLGEKLAARAQEILDERTRANMWVFEYDNVIDYNIGSRHTLMGGAADINWYGASGWRERTKELYDAAAEVAGALRDK
jgi:hypothetical protein